MGLWIIPVVFTWRANMTVKRHVQEVLAKRNKPLDNAADAGPCPAKASEEACDSRTPELETQQSKNDPNDPEAVGSCDAFTADIDAENLLGAKKLEKRRERLAIVAEQGSEDSWEINLPEISNQPTERIEAESPLGAPKRNKKNNKERRAIGDEAGSEDFWEADLPEFRTQPTEDAQEEAASTPQLPDIAVGEQEAANKIQAACKKPGDKDKKRKDELKSKGKANAKKDKKDNKDRGKKEDREDKKDRAEKAREKKEKDSNIKDKGKAKGEDALSQQERAAKTIQATLKHKEEEKEMKEGARAIKDKARGSPADGGNNNVIDQGKSKKKKAKQKEKRAAATEGTELVKVDRAETSPTRELRKHKEETEMKEGTRAIKDKARGSPADRGNNNVIDQGKSKKKKAKQKEKIAAATEGTELVKVDRAETSPTRELRKHKEETEMKEGTRAIKDKARG